MQKTRNRKLHTFLTVEAEVERFKFEDRSHWTKESVGQQAWTLL
jgi:hypothetical protein